ncbi:MAG: hypothetical protein D6806_06810 [Deltaproteobacteria bacterium]|nr:MAG: hypothetical protein D6806_06810 [Deltaproteobacteria bacterium]
MFAKAVQFCVWMDNHEGAFGEFCELFYENGIDIIAMSLRGDSEVGVLRMVVDAPDRARELLSKSGLNFRQTEVLLVEVPNRAGMAAGVGHRFSQAGIDIEYAYFSAGPSDAPARMVFKVRDIDAALSKLHESSRKYN